MSYIKRKGYGMMGVGGVIRGGRTGLGGAENCSASQDWDAGCNFQGVQGQCVPRGMVGKQPGCMYPASSSSTWDAILSAGKTLFSGGVDILKAKVTPAPVTQISTTTSGGMSTTTKVALAGAAGLGLLLVLKSRKK